MASGKWRLIGRLRSGPILLAGVGVAAFGLIAFANEKADISNLKPQAVDVTTRNIAAFDTTKPDQRDFGRLTWRGEVVLSSGSDYFGGYSAIALDDKGEKVLAISDSGSWMTARLTYKDAQLAGIADTRIGPLTQKDGRPLQDKRDRDAEGLVQLKHGAIEGRYLVTFERAHRVDEYALEDGIMRGPLGNRPLPKIFGDLGKNEGIEGATQLRGGPLAGALVLFGEQLLTKDGNLTGALVVNGEAKTLTMKRYESYDVSDIQSLADGSLVVLERSFNPVNRRLGIRLRLIKAEDVKPGIVIEGENLLDAGPGQEIDNFEGLAVHETAAGETMLTLMSDDNFSFFQRTLLVQFKLN